RGSGAIAERRFACESKIGPIVGGRRRGGMADAPALGAGARKGVEVQILSPTPERAPKNGVNGSASPISAECRCQLLRSTSAPRKHGAGTPSGSAVAVVPV